VKLRYKKRSVKKVVLIMENKEWFLLIRGDQREPHNGSGILYILAIEVSKNELRLK
jgi:hypothetical protein